MKEERKGKGGRRKKKVNSPVELTQLSFWYFRCEVARYTASHRFPVRFSQDIIVPTLFPNFRCSFTLPCLLTRFK
jgi:hypothetical protein